MKVILSLIILLVSANARSGIYEPHVLWDKKEIRVCFFDSYDQLSVTEFSMEHSVIPKQGFAPSFFDPKEKLDIQQTVTQAYSKDLTGIHFIGWDACSQVKEFDVIIIKAGPIVESLWSPIPADFEGRASMGESGVRTDQGYLTKNLSIIPSVILKHTDSYVVNHEFGHIAGLRHEHIHPDSKLDKKHCIDWERRDLRTKEKPDPTTIFHTVYDKESIMNYCSRVTRKTVRKSFLHSVLSGELSPLDMKTLKDMYRERD